MDEEENAYDIDLDEMSRAEAEQFAKSLEKNEMMERETIHGAKRPGENSDNVSGISKRQRVLESEEASLGRHDAPLALSEQCADTIQVTTTDGRKLTFQKRHGNSARAQQDLDEFLGGSGILGARSSRKLAAEVAELSFKLERNAAKEAEAVAARSGAEASSKAQGRTKSTELWVDKYRPRSFLHLLSDERTNRSVLQWIKSWDKVVFGKEFNLAQGHGVIDATALEGKVLLLHGPPGLGKTTLAHILARTAGYAPVEINASDERSASGLKARLEALMEMRSMMGEKRPNCVILDEIDGTTGSEGHGAIDVILKLCALDSRSGGSTGGGRGHGHAGGGMDERGEDDDDAEEGKEEANEKDVPEEPVAKKGRGSKKKQAARQQKLNRPIICICNDLYAPSLRALRAIAYAVKFTPPSEQKMIARLQHISAQEKLRIERQALAVLYEMHAGDIRSCINALQMVALQAHRSDVTTKNLRELSTSIRDTGMSTGIFDVWTAIFAVKTPTSGNESKAAAASKGARNKDVKELLRAHSSSMQVILQGCHHNFVRAKYTDPRMQKTSKTIDALSDSDVLSAFINKSQHYSLLPHLASACMQVHLCCASPQSMQVEYPRAASEATQHQKHSMSLLHASMVAMVASLRPQYTPRIMTTQAAPYIVHILQPDIKLANMHLMSAKDKESLEHHVQVMMSLGLTYKLSSKEGKSGLSLEPRLDEVVKLPKEGGGASAVLSQDLMRHIQKMIEVAEARKHMDPSIRTPDKSTTTPPMANKTTTKIVVAGEIPSKALSFGHAGWGTLSQHQSKNSATSCTNTFPVRFVFNEGITNAIKRPVMMRDLFSQ